MEVAGEITGRSGKKILIVLNEIEIFFRYSPSGLAEANVDTFNGIRNLSSTIILNPFLIVLQEPLFGFFMLF